MKGNSRAYAEAQESPDDGGEKKRKRHTRNLFQWLDQVALDHDLPPAAFKVAYVIGQHVNRQSGEAWPSTDSIAHRAGLAQSTVRSMVDRLEESGHLAVDYGSRGHPNKYRPITKDQVAFISKPRKERTAAILDASAKERFRQIKERCADVKERRSAMNHL
jgi:DNA-binding MarR family transcriptional regulator